MENGRHTSCCSLPGSQQERRTDEVLSKDNVAADINMHIAFLRLYVLEWFFMFQVLHFPFLYLSPLLWNNLPVELRQRDICLSEFRRLLKTFLFC